MKLGYLTICVYLSVLTAISVQADTIFLDDFQDSNYNGWTVSGSGYYPAVTWYGSNASLRLRKTRTLTRAVPTTAYMNVNVSAKIAASSLEGSDQCLAEVSTNGGTSWHNILQVVNGQDDGYTMYSGSISPSGINDNANVVIRLRINANGNADYCWFDDILVSGTPGTGSGSPEISISGSGGFGNVNVGETEINTITVTNEGDADLIIGTLSGLSSPFSINNDNCSNTTITEGNNCTALIQYSPTAQSTSNDTLNIPSNDNDEPNSTVNISGTGTSSGGGSCDYDCLSGNGNVSRSSATYNQLTGASSVGLVDYSHYAVPSNAANPTNTFEGALTLTITDGTLTEQGTSLASAYTNPDRMPNFSYQFVQHGTHLIPVERGVLNSSSSDDWEYILAPGRVWNENNDNGYSRVALPFALQERNANCTHNGVMTFLFKDDGTVSQVAYQIAQETCVYFKYNLHGELNASFSPGNVSGSTTLKNTYETEVSNRMPTKDISELAIDYPGNGVVTGNIGSEVTANHMTLFGIAYNGVNYTGGCVTRKGSYPYCDVMAVPSYSTAKSVVGGFGLMRLEQLYSGSQSDLVIGNYVNECGSQWNDVTFENTLDMATGNYTSNGFETDEGSTNTTNNFFLVDTHSQKVSHACAYTRKTTPATSWVYHTSDTYLLGRGMNQYYKGLTGNNADLFNDLLVEDIYKPLGMSPLTYKSKRTYDTTAQFWAGFGLTYHRDDALKLGEFLNKSNGQINGIQTLDSAMLNAALQKDSADRGLSAGSANDKYQNSFWAYNLNASSTLSSCTTDTWVPYMSGYGGIGIMMFSNDMVYYFFSDNEEYAFTTTAKELDKIANVCP